jgi:hypothetical protein
MELGTIAVVALVQVEPNKGGEKMARITIEAINEELAPTGWKCISTEYKNLDGELQFNCEEGHLVCAPWKKIRAKRDCPVCNKNVFKTRDKVLEVEPKPKGQKRVLALD